MLLDERVFGGEILQKARVFEERAADQAFAFKRMPCIVQQVVIEPGEITSILRDLGTGISIHRTYERIAIVAGMLFEGCIVHVESEMIQI